MIIRPLDVRQFDEAKAVAEVQSVAFRSPGGYRAVLDEIKKAEAEQRLLQGPEGKKPVAIPWGAFLDDTLIAVVYAIDFKMRFEGQVVNMCGIAGVGTRPEYRRQGAIRKIMQAIFEDTPHKNQIFSYLYPFSFAYYHQFGYDFGCRRIKADIPFGELRQFAPSGQVRLADRLDQPVIEKIYNQFIEHTNGALVREGTRWSMLLDKNPYLDQRYTYIWADDHGSEKGYMVYEKKTDPAFPNPGDEIFHVLDWAVTDTEALKGLLSFIRRFDSQFRLLEMRFPVHMPVESLFNEVDPVQRTLQTAGQIRVLNIRQAMLMLKLPSWLPELTCKIAVSDVFLPDNSGIYQVNLSHTGNHVFFKPQDISPGTKADLHISAEALASLLLGSRDLNELTTVSEAELSQELSDQQKNLILAFFRSKPACIYDYF